MTKSVNESLHKIELRPADPEKALSGHNAVLLMDGEPMKGVQSIQIHLEANQVFARAYIDLLVDVSVEGQMDVKKTARPRKKTPAS